jgi:hypothetical protein
MSRTTLSIRPAFAKIIEDGSVNPRASISERVNTLAARYVAMLGPRPSFSDQEWIDFITALNVVNLGSRGLQYELVGYFKATKVNSKLGYSLDSMKTDAIFAAVDYAERFIASGRDITLESFSDWRNAQDPK